MAQPKSVPKVNTTVTFWFWDEFAVFVSSVDTCGSSSCTWLLGERRKEKSRLHSIVLSDGNDHLLTKAFLHICLG